MKPKQIVVFDGLRITTEHLDHLQGAFLTGLHDLREAAGLGKVLRGLQVRTAQENQIVVEPGLAFDREGNRIVCDAPQTLDVAFQEGEQSLWVTIAYDQLETNETEGKNTLVWDGCMLGLQPAAPGPDDLAIAIAWLEHDEVGALAVHPADTQPAPERPAGENGSTAAGDGQTPSGSGESNSSLPPAGDSLDKRTTSNGATGPSEPMSRLAVDQGITQLSSPASPYGSPLKSLAAVVRAQSPEAGQPGPSLTLATAEIDIPFQLLSLSCQSILTASIIANESETATPTALPTLHAAAWGDVSPRGETLAQHALVSCNAGYSPFFPLLTEGLVGQLSLNTWAELAPQPETAPASSASGGAPETPSGLAVCRYLHLSVRVAQSDIQRLQFVLTLDWKGGPEEERIRLLERSIYRFQTDVQVGWKALGSAA
jgi:hypothetical protein